MIKDATMAADSQIRVSVDLQIRVWGMNSDGKPFSLPARTVEIFATGAVINKVECALTVGDVIGVQYQNKKARCRVASAEEHGFLEKTRAELVLVEGQECPWLAEIPKDAPKDAPNDTAGKITVVELAGNKRRFCRHRIYFNIEFCDERVNTQIRTRATDISGAGCYVETMQPMAVGTILHIEFWMDSEKVATSGIVRAHDPGVGMGIEFTGLVQEMQNRLQQYLDKLAAQPETLARAADAGLPGLV
jgi:hypothetical protein